MHATSFSVSFLLLTAGLTAQVVSPVGFGSIEASSNNTYPFTGSAFTYQQIHSDLRGTPRPVTALAFRRDGTLTSAYAARTVVVDVWMGDGDRATATTTFATNFATTPTQVMTNRTVNLPDHSAVPVALPAAFDTVLTFDVPFVYTGVQDLIWELRMSSNTLTTSYPMDAASGATNTPVNGNAMEFGTGCTTPRGVMKLRWTGSTTSTQHSIRWSVTNGPASSQGAVVVGNLVGVPLPGFCDTIRTDGAFFSLSGTTSSTGTLATPTTLTFPYNPSFAGFPLAAQAVVLDATQPGIGLALSNGLLVTIPDVVAAGVQCMRISATNSATATTGSVGNNYALVTEFR